MRDIILSTGGISSDYEVIDPVFVIGGAKEGMFSKIDPFKAFEDVKGLLRDSCKNMGGDAVLFCQFEYRDAVTGIVGSKQALEILAYGTVVKIK